MFASIVSSLLLLPGHSVAAGRDAVKKAIAATVAVEWCSDRNVFPSPTAPGANPAPQEPVAENDPATGTQRVRALYYAAQPQAAADFEMASGVVVSADGLIVIVGREGQGTYNVCLDDGRKLLAKVLVDDRRTGLRLLKVDAQGLHDLSLSDSQPDVGDLVFAAFCSDRRERAAAQGMIAARQAPAFGGHLQLDIAVGRASAGGPVIDDQGRLVGIIDSKHSGRPVDDTAIYAVPSDAVRALLHFRQAEQEVVVHRGMLGIALDSESDASGERLTARPLPESPAAAAGIKAGDELTAIDGQKVVTAREVVAAVARHAPGDKVSVTVQREGREQQFEVTVGRQPLGEATLPPAVSPPPPTEGTINVLRPEQLYVLTQDGKTVAVAATKEQLEPLRTAARALRLTRVPGGIQPVPPTAANVIRVERSDLEKKLDEVGHNLQTLQQQVVQLTEEIKSLRGRLAEEKK